MLPRLKKFLRRMFYSARFLPVAALLMLTVTVVVYASYIGEGHKKGVLVAADYYFTSNILAQTENIADAENINRSCIVTVNGNGSADIEIRNYNAASQYNAFDMDYNVYFWLDEAVDNSNPYEYTIDFGDVDPIAVTTTVQSRSYTLPYIARPNQNTFSVNFTLKDGYAPDLTAAVGICVAAIPTAPEYMVTYPIGATIVLTDIIPGFSVATDFVFDDTYTLDDLAGFLYQITTAGVPEEGTTITVSWDAVKLQLDQTDPLCQSVITGTSVTDENDVEISRIDSVVISDVGMNELYTLPFFRAPGSDAFWAAQLSAQLSSITQHQSVPTAEVILSEDILDNLVTVTVNTPQPATP